MVSPEKTEGRIFNFAPLQTREKMLYLFSLRWGGRRGCRSEGVDVKGSRYEE
jgi:hypothetical protein